MANKFPPLLNLSPTGPIRGYTARKAAPLIAILSLSAAIAILALQFSTSLTKPTFFQRNVAPSNAQEILQKCQSLRAFPGPSPRFERREVSDRYEPGTNATWIRNCRILTGENNGSVIIHGDLFLDKGIVKALGKIPWRLPDSTPNVTIVDADGAWITPGLSKCLVQRD